MFYIEHYKPDSEDGVSYYSVMSSQSDSELMTWRSERGNSDSLDWEEALDRAMQLVSYLNGGARPSWLTRELYS